jgi:hypothetical protein
MKTSLIVFPVVSCESGLSRRHAVDERDGFGTMKNDRICP